MIVRIFHGSEPQHIREAVRLLAEWDGRMKTGSEAAPLYAAFISELAGQILLDDLGETLFNMTVAMDQMVIGGLLKMLQSSLYTAESRKASLRSALQAAMETLSAHFGENPGSWSWGGMHQMDFVHLLGGNPLLRQSLNRGPFQLGGDGSTLSATGYRLTPPYAIRSANTARIVLHTGNPDNSAVLLAPGQSGHALDEHYRDQIQLYLNDMYHATLMDTAKIRVSGWKKLRLMPENTPGSNRY
jgi:penicillin amidase